MVEQRLGTHDEGVNRINGDLFLTSFARSAARQGPAASSRVVGSFDLHQASMTPSTSVPYISSLREPTPGSADSSRTVDGRLSAIACSVASVNTT